MPLGKLPLIYVAENDLAVATTITTTLQRHGFLEDYFTSPPEALRAARSNVPDPLARPTVVLSNADRCGVWKIHVGRLDIRERESN